MVEKFHTRKEIFDATSGRNLLLIRLSQDYQKLNFKINPFKSPKKTFQIDPVLVTFRIELSETS